MTVGYVCQIGSRSGNAPQFYSWQRIPPMCPPVPLPPCKTQLWVTCAGSRSGNALQFYSWQRFTPVGSPLVEPKWIQWDPDVTVAALAYSDSLVLYRSRPTFKPMASLSIQVYHSHFAKASKVCFHLCCIVYTGTS